MRSYIYDSLDSELISELRWDGRATGIEIKDAYYENRYWSAEAP